MNTLVPESRGPLPLAPEQEAEVKRRLAEGQAVTVIAYRLGVRKSQVLAIRHRMSKGRPLEPLGEPEQVLKVGSFQHDD